MTKKKKNHPSSLTNKGLKERVEGGATRISREMFVDINKLFLSFTLSFIFLIRMLNTNFKRIWVILLIRIYICANIRIHPKFLPYYLSISLYFKYLNFLTRP